VYNPVLVLQEAPPKKRHKNEIATKNDFANLTFEQMHTTQMESAQIEKLKYVT
jgi:hypothetical protein